MHTTPPSPQRKYRTVSPNRVVATFVRDWLERSDYTSRELSEAIGTHREALQRVARGDRRLYLDEALMLVDALGMEPGVLLELRDALKRRGS